MKTLYWEYLAIFFYGFFFASVIFIMVMNKLLSVCQI